MLWLVTRMPSILPLESISAVSRSSAKRLYPLMVRLRNFENAAFAFSTEAVLTEVFESVKSCIIARECLPCLFGVTISNIYVSIAAMPENLYAFSYAPRPPLALSPQGWHIYDAKAEFARQGVGSRTKAWRYCNVNTGYGVSTEAWCTENFQEIEHLHSTVLLHLPSTSLRTFSNSRFYNSTRFQVQIQGKDSRPDLPSLVQFSEHY